MDIIKLKEKFGKPELLKEQIKELDKKVLSRQKDLEVYLHPIMDNTYKKVCDEVHEFFTSNGFKLKVDDCKRRYQYGDDEVIVVIYKRKRMPLTIDIEIKTEKVNKQISLYPVNDKDKYYYGEEPWNRVEMNKNYLCFTIYMLDSFKDVESLEKVKCEYEKVLERISYTENTITNLTDFSYEYENINKSSFEEIFKVI